VRAVEPIAIVASRIDARIAVVAIRVARRITNKYKKIIRDSPLAARMQGFSRAALQATAAEVRRGSLSV